MLRSTECCLQKMVCVTGWPVCIHCSVVSQEGPCQFSCVVWHPDTDLPLAYGCLLSYRLVPASLRMFVSLTTWVCLLMATVIRHASIGFGPMVVRHLPPPYCSDCIALHYDQSYASQSLTRFSSVVMGRTWGVFRCSLFPQEWHTFNIFTLCLKI